MTNTPMSDLDPKVKELLEAARHVVDTGERNGLYRLGNAIAAFDPPKPEPVPVIPAWEEFVKGKEQIWLIGPDDKTPCGVRLHKNEIAAVWREDYDLLRSLTAKAPTE